tara:strand:+ start:302 stop:508 length:207 start_codon:yes stop_codon:yes gene_type:complete
MKKNCKSLLNFFKVKEKNNHMTIAELKAFNLNQVKIKKEKRFRVYISEINKRYNEMRKIERNSLSKIS